MLVGYARTSTADQEAGLAGQVRDLQAFGCERIFSEQVSSVAARPQMAAALDFVRAGDVLAITKPDRLARNAAGLLDIVADLEKREVGLVILSMGGGVLDTRVPTSKFMLTMLAAVAEFERALMLERQREGIAKAAADGKFKGRKPTARNQSEEVLKLLAEDVPVQTIAKQLGMSRMSVYRIRDDAAGAAA